MMIHQSSQPGDMEHLPVSLRIGHWVSFPMETSTGVFSTSQNGLGTRNPILETNPLPLCQRHVSIMGHNKQPSSSASLWLAHTNLRTPSSQVFGLLLLSMGGHGWNHGPSPQAFNTPKKTTIVWKLLRNGAQERWCFSFDGMPWGVYTYSQFFSRGAEMKFDGCGWCGSQLHKLCFPRTAKFSKVSYCWWKKSFTTWDVQNPLWDKLPTATG